MYLGLAKMGGAHGSFVNGSKSRTTRARMAEQFRVEEFIAPVENQLEYHGFSREIDHVPGISSAKVQRQLEVRQLGV